MSMNLTLAIALECSPEECQIELVESGEKLTVRYSAPIQKNIKIFPGQLVALDLNPAIPEVVYRWHYLAVRQVLDGKVVLEDGRGRAVDATLAPGVETLPQVEDWVFATVGGYPAQAEVIDTAIDGHPAHPDQVARYTFPLVEEFYRKLEGKG
jgi:hypothetical protein